MSDSGYWWAWGVDAEAHRRVKRPFDRAARAAAGTGLIGFTLTAGALGEEHGRRKG